MSLGGGQTSGLLCGSQSDHNDDALPSVMLRQAHWLTQRPTSCTAIYKTRDRWAGEVGARTDVRGVARRKRLGLTIAQAKNDTVPSFREKANCVLWAFSAVVSWEPGGVAYVSSSMSGKPVGWTCHGDAPHGRTWTPIVDFRWRDMNTLERLTAKWGFANPVEKNSERVPSFGYFLT